MKNASIGQNKFETKNIKQCLFLTPYIMQNSHPFSCSTAGVVVSCKIPILATRVRFPGSAHFCIFFSKVWFENPTYRHSSSIIEVDNWNKFHISFIIYRKSGICKILNCMWNIPYWKFDALKRRNSICIIPSASNFSSNSLPKLSYTPERK